jgi:hypothetical protein
VDLARIDAPAGEQTLDVAVTSGSAQKMFGFDRGVAQHARLVIAQQDRVVCLVGKPPQRVLLPRDRDAGTLHSAATATVRSQQRTSCLCVLLAGLRHARADRAL